MKKIMSNIGNSTRSTCLHLEKSGLNGEWRLMGPVLEQRKCSEIVWWLCNFCIRTFKAYKLVDYMVCKLYLSRAVSKNRSQPAV